MLAAACGGRDVPTRPSTSSTAAVSPSAASTTGQSRGLAAATAPERPQSLAASVSGSTVTLTWLAPTSQDPATSYVIEAGPSAGSTSSAQLDTLNTATSFTATGVPAGTYFVRVRARNSAGTSAASNEVVFVIGVGGCTSAPGVPTGLTASVSGSSVTLSWTGPAGGCAATGFMIEAGSSSGLSDLASVNTGSTATTFSAGGVGNGTYFVRVRAVNSYGQSAASNEITLVVGAGATVTGTWVGLAANGEGATSTPGACGVEKSDLRFELIQTGSSVTGTLTQTTVVSACGGVGQVQMAPITGTASAGTFSFSVNRPGATPHVGSATFTPTRMTGTRDNGGSTSFNNIVVNKQ
jgi:predicted phage tail protein